MRHFAFFILLWISSATLHAQSQSTLRELLLAQKGKWAVWDGTETPYGAFKIKSVETDFLRLQWSEDKRGKLEYIVPFEAITYIVLTSTDTLRLVTRSRSTPSKRN